MNFKIYKTKDYLTKKWSGGKTTELFIFPENSTYENLDFKFRLSSASIEAESSNFTILPNIKRKLFILDGSIKIKHDNSEYKILNKFDVDNFNGSEITTSLGKCIDFNLMSKNIKTGSKIHAKALINEYKQLDLSMFEKFDLLIKKVRLILILG